MQPFEVQFERMKKAVNVESDTAFACFLGISQGSVSGAKAQKKIPPAWFFQVADKTGLSVDFLYSGKSSPGQPRVVESSTSEEAFISVPIVEARLSAGLGSLQVGAGIERHYSFPSAFLCRKGNPKNMVLMQVDGDSMQPEILDGDLVLLDQSKTDIRLGRIFAVRFEEAIYLKRIDMLPGKIILRSVNPEYKPVEIEISEYTADQFRVIGQVLWVGREYHE